MGFIPFPLGVPTIRIVSQDIQITNFGETLFFLFLCFFAFLCLGAFKILSNIATLGKACDLSHTHQRQCAAAVAASLGA